MMTEEKRIEWLLELQDHAEQLTDEQLQQILADDEMRQLVKQLGFAKRAFKRCGGRMGEVCSQPFRRVGNPRRRRI